MYRLFTFQRLAHSLLVSAAMGLTMTAQAASPESSAAAGKNKHCVTQLAPLVEGQKASAAIDMGCFPSFAESMAAATGGAVSLSPDATPESMTESDISPSATRIIGIDYDGRNYGGGTSVWYSNNPYGCLGGRSYVNNMPGYFNNRLTSTRGFGGCSRNTSYSGYYQTGFYLTCRPSCSFIGSFLNNQTSSKSWSR
jgi:hypothetical protein